MKNKLFRIRYQPLRTFDQERNQLSVTDDLFAKHPEKSEWILGGVNLCGPMMYQCDPIATPKLNWCIWSSVVEINSSSLESLFYLQKCAGLWIAGQYKDIESNLFEFDNCGGGFGVSRFEPNIEIGPGYIGCVLCVRLSGDFCNLEFVPRFRLNDKSDLNPVVQFRLHPFVFINEVLRIQKQFEQTIRQHDKDLYNLVGHERFTEIVQTNSLIKTPEEHFDLTERYFAGNLLPGEHASYLWYNLEQLFTDHLEKEGLTNHDVERIIKDEEDKWKKENPGKALAAEQIEIS